MSAWLLYNLGASPQSVITYLPTVPDDSIYISLPNAINNPDISGVATLSQQYWKVVGTSVLSMTAQEIAAVDAANAAATNLSQRSEAQANVTSPLAIGKLERAAVDIIIQEFNKHKTFEDGLSSATSTWITTFLAAVAAASSLADLKTRIAAMAAFAPPATIATATLSGAKTAIINDIASGGEGD